MKIWVRTEAYNAGTAEEPDYLPDLGGNETDPDIRFSLMKVAFPDDVLCRVAGPQAKVRDIERATAPNPQTDDQARSIIKTHHPNSDLENVDIPDPELDSMLEAMGENPIDVRSDIQTPTTGNQVLQDQELHAMEVVAQKRGKDISPHEKGIKRGRKDEHEKAMKRLRKVGKE